MLYLGGLHEAWNTWDRATKAGSFSIHTITAGAQYSHAWNTEDGAADSNTQSISDDQHVIVKLHDGSAAYAATFTEFISTGVTANWSDVETANKYWPALAIQEFTSSSITLTVAEIAHANALDATGKLPQVHKLVPGEAIHANALDAPALSQVHKLIAPDIIHANALDAIGALPMSKTLVVSEIAHANALDAAGKLAPTPLNQVAKLSIPEAALVVAQPFDPSALAAIEKAILSADLGLNPSNDGKLIRVPIPPLTEERRKQLVKKVHGLGEEAKTAIRQLRREANEEIKKLQKDGKLSEDDGRRALDDIQKKTDHFNEEVDGLCRNKEKELMAV